MNEPRVVNQVEACVDQILERLNGNVVLGIPLGLGKPNQFVNALYRRACEDSSISLKIITALSLDVPAPRGDVEKRFAGPLMERLFGGYEPLAYVSDIKRNQVPSNIEVCEFFVKPGEYLGKPYAQQHYISSNYTHVARDLIAQGVNVLAQLVAYKGEGQDRRYSLSCNPDVTLDLVEMLDEEECFEEKSIITVAQLHKDLPFMENEAEVSDEYFDFVIENPEYDTRLFATPNGPVGLVDHLIGFYASTLIKDNGTLQIGIGSMSDALVQACLVRHQSNDVYQSLSKALLVPERYESLIREYGGDQPFDKGLYGSSEMFVNGFRFLIDAGIIKRKVYGDLETQRKANRGEVIPDDIKGTIMHGGFFLGPDDFYQWLDELSDELQKSISMVSIGFVNQLTHAPKLLRAQRKHARFVNTGLMATLNGSVVSDGLEDGQVLSGVGGQYNFVAMAHQLADARSMLMIRSTRKGKAGLESNIRFSYGHCTIPRHLRDIVITEYGIADLRGKGDADVYKAMINIADSRFQEALLEQAKAAGKVEKSWQVPEVYRFNTPDVLKQKLAEVDKATAFPEYPLGHSFSDIELELMPALKKLKAWSKDQKTLLALSVKALFFTPAETSMPALARMDYADEPSLLEYKDRITRGLIAMALEGAA